MNERLGIRGNNNINNNNQNNANANVQNNINNNNSNIKRTFTNEELLERIDLTHDYNNNFISYKKYNFEETLNENPTLKKFLDVKKIQNKLNILKEK